MAHKLIVLNGLANNGAAPNQSLSRRVEYAAMHGNPRLSHLLQLAEQGPALRAALALELTELLAFWPSDCPHDMRSPCEALLTRAVREVDETVRAEVRTKLRADPALAARVLPNDNLARTLIEMTRAGLDIRPRMAEALNLSQSRLEEILATDHGLALICKALSLSRTTFSTLTMLMSRNAGLGQCHAALDRYEEVTEDEVAGLRTAHMGEMISFPREPRDVRAS